MTSSRRRDFDVVLRFMHMCWKNEQEELPESERVTWAVWMRAAGVMTPIRMASVRKYEQTRSYFDEPNSDEED